MLSTLLQPDLVLGGNVLNLSPDLWQRHNLKGLILDVDDTLVPLGQTETPADLLLWMNQAKQMGQVWLVSNNVNSHRIQRIADRLQVPYLTSAAKPSRRKLQQALEGMALAPDQVAMVGDRLFTDVLAGNRLGLFTILVDPIPASASRPAISLLRWLEVTISRALGVTLSRRTSSPDALASQEPESQEI
ncbi:MAG: YqeG family HAD IIIA-type phosphatase [Cyanobacteria bacterium REEB459]|nr:YqeG family HAD IIIA-type phosphatase [Cyanobacteria bacterium REEB459]